MEQPGFFDGHSGRLFGFYHEPREPRASQAFVLSHAFGEEKLWSHRVLVSFARELAERGYPVFRFDYTGTGDSDGSLAETSIASHVLDLAAAVRWLNAKLDGSCQIGLVGLRLGATIAALLAGQHPPCTDRLGPLVLWDPVTDGESYVQELLRSHLSTQLAVHGRVIEGRDALRERIRRGESVNLDGYELAAPLHDSCARKDLLSGEARGFQGDALVVQISPAASGKPRQDLVALAQTYSRGSLASCAEEPFWREIRPFYGRAVNLQAVTVDWLEKLRASH
jgi:exosortase A-associated hydrolase 2